MGVTSRSRVIVGGLAGVVGLIWLGQGLGFIPGSFMTGDPTWAIAGALTLVVGAAVAWSGIGAGSGRGR